MDIGRMIKYVTADCLYEFYKTEQQTMIEEEEGADQESAIPHLPLETEDNKQGYGLITRL